MFFGIGLASTPRSNDRWTQTYYRESFEPAAHADLHNDTPAVRMELDYVMEHTLSAMIGIMNYWFIQIPPIPNE
ncbi:MAG: hypothetical protein CVV52_03145 [Spirochaetae bacterium HGW-Spirochaetae-8]|nr:MAG: hypothetical protein CVV52_03145 [Spirochaetae bacterium HGW-Spirochaetae-8]